MQLMTFKWQTKEKNRRDASTITYIGYSIINLGDQIAFLKFLCLFYIFKIIFIYFGLN